MLDSVVDALVILSDPSRIAFVVLGTTIGLMIGIIPGIGGLVGLALLLPFTFNMDPYAALAFLIGVSAVTVTSDTIPAVLFGVPGTVGSAATVLDGYPMARRGEAGRAFGAAFSSSVIGGLFGATVLALLIPILQPLLKFIASPELLAICILGMTMVAAVSQGAMLKGLALACFGILIASIGDESQTGELRWVYDQIYLWDGLSLIPIALGLFAVPELVDLAIGRTSVSQKGLVDKRRWQQWRGVSDTLNNLPIVFRSATIGSSLGSIPGVGAAVIDWIAYGVAAKTVKGGSESFGVGDVRGVIASESANNAKEGGALIPTLAFGVPGSASMALLLGAFMMHGINPGPNLLEENLHITYTLVFSVALANIIGAGLCFAFADKLAKVATIRSMYLVPVVLAVTVIGAFQGGRDMGDLYVLVIFSLIGWYFKRVGWPRPPLLLGFVLGDLMEGYLFISVVRYEFAWLYRPAVLILLGTAVFLTFWPALKNLWTYLVGKNSEIAVSEKIKNGMFSGQNIKSAVLSLPLFIIFIFGIYSSEQWDFEAKLMPVTACYLGLVLILLDFSRITGRIESLALNSQKQIDIVPHLYYRRALKQFLWIFFVLILVKIVGMLPALLLFVSSHMIVDGKISIGRALLISMASWFCMFGIFDYVLHIPWPDSLLGKAIVEAMGNETPYLLRRLF